MFELEYDCEQECGCRCVWNCNAVVERCLRRLDPLPMRLLMVVVGMVVMDSFVLNMCALLDFRLMDRDLTLTDLSLLEVRTEFWKLRRDEEFLFRLVPAKSFCRR